MPGLISPFRRPSLSPLTVIVGSPTTQPMTSPPSSSKYQHVGFSTASRALDGRNNMQPPPRVTSVDHTRHLPLAPGSSGAAPQPAGPFPAPSIKDGRTLEKTSPVIQYGPNIYSSPPTMHATNPHPSPPSTRPPNASRNQYTFPGSQAPPQHLPPSSGSASLHPVGTLASLSPPPATSQPSQALGLDIHPAPARTSPVPRESVNRNGKSPENRQGVFANSPPDHYPRLDSRAAALPPRSASTSGGPLVAVAPTPIKPSPQELEVRMCVVCFEQEPEVRFAARCPTARCEHRPSVCTVCVERHILVAIHHSRSVEIRCPHMDCGKMLEYQDVYSSVRDWGQLVL